MSSLRVRYPEMLLAAIFMGAGFSAVFAQEQVRVAFQAWGYPDWVRIAVGIVQATAGGSMLILKAVPAASAVLAVVMVGAIATHLRAGEYPYALIPLAFLAALIFVGLKARRDLKQG